MACEPCSPALRRTARFTAALTFLLVLAGGLVTSRNAGLAVPDWPLSFGSLNPPHWYAIENVRTEHGHRLIAACVALCTFVLGWLVYRHETRPWVRKTTALAVVAVLAQAALGGLRVLELSIDLAVIHGALGQIFFSLTVLIAAATSPSWQTLEQNATARRELSPSAGVLVTLLLMQLGLGLDLRHLVAASGRDLLSVAPFYAHIGVGLCIAVATLWVLVSTLRETDAHPSDALLRRSAVALVSLVVVQLVLGFATFMVTNHMSLDREPSAMEGWIPTIHVGVGALLLATSSLFLVRTRVAQQPADAATSRAWAVS